MYVIIEGGILVVLVVVLEVGFDFVYFNFLFKYSSEDKFSYGVFVVVDIVNGVIGG